MSEDAGEMKVKKALQSGRGSGFSAYRRLIYGDTSLGYMLWAGFVFWFSQNIRGAAGLLLRSKLYRTVFGSAGRKPLIGKNVTLRHPRKIRLGNNVIIDDNCVIDAKGADNHGITIDDNVFIGRNTIIYCKNGNIHLKKGVNISSNCTVFSSNDLTIEEDVLIGGYSYLLSGGEYNYQDPSTKFVDQTGAHTRGPLVIGSNTWLGARVTVLDGASIGQHCVIGAGAVVTKRVPPNSLAVGVPARLVKSL
jgi:acetyltransferase-like isoleucine patch superfamily enzyme